MRKLFALLFVAVAFTFAACEKKTETTEKVDTVGVDPQPQPEMKADSMATDSMPN
jgi:hypothetical protein